jgi:hypothetical protein
MKDHGQLLDESRNFCDASTGEVLQRIPEELMNKLRAAKLARGIPGGRNESTGTYATWFVFFSDGIRDEVLAKWREANRQRRQRRTAAGKANRQPVAAGVDSRSSEASEQAVQQSRQRRKSAK